MDRTKTYFRQQAATAAALDGNHSLKRILNLVGRDRHVLDAGCATGYLANLLQQQGCEVTGIELNPDAACEAESYCNHVHVADLDITPLSELLAAQRFDAIICGDVLEHLRQPAQFLNAARQHLASGGRVIASLPNVAHGAVRLMLWQGAFNYTPYGILDNTHLRFFTRATAIALFEETGYEIASLETTQLPILAYSDLLPDFDREAIPAGGLAQLQQDPDAETVQFIICATPLDSESHCQHLQTQLQTTRAELAQTRKDLAALQASRWWQWRDRLRRFLGKA
ncbi:MAG: class I SAM-dependent methyltransferase [Spirulinaceae cyanobacterium RM2_2_10]|nr:class I SAM-dependent methyltransferase [Spirulinaceae cyanobacterium SM2_1_0]NJO19777.1 class I SAM-dependent methyltransferase [Spirulinaceae cyanobacterium RM2_2_10]